MSGSERGGKDVTEKGSQDILSQGLIFLTSTVTTKSLPSPDKGFRVWSVHRLDLGSGHKCGGTT